MNTEEKKTLIEEKREQKKANPTIENINENGEKVIVELWG